MRQAHGEKERVLTRGGLADTANAMNLAVVVEIRFVARSQPKP